jgi:5-methylcytosine-specific restriction endonuclease McrA
MKKTQRSHNSTLRLVSPRQKPEIARRDKLRKEADGMCRTCIPNHWVGKYSLELSHKIPLSRGGRTDRINCVVECRVAHDKYEKHPERRPIGG